MNNDSRVSSLTAQSIELLRQLVAFDSVSRNSNLPIIQFIEDYLRKLNIPFWLAPSPDNSKTNLIARIGPDVEGGIVLSGHTDVVPVDGQPWATDPFTLTEKDGKLYGRGTSDMKSFLAICLALAPEFKKCALTKPVWLAFSYDEEVGCLGAPHLLEFINKHLPRPAFAVIGEPTLMQVVTAHKGVLSFETTVHGLEWHSSQPHLGVNAVQYACSLVHFLSTMAQEVATLGRRDERFNPPYTTVHVGVIQGGTARNIIPLECKFNWEIRPFPGDQADFYYKRFEARAAELLIEMQKVHKQANITTRPISRMPGVTLPVGAEASAQAVLRCAQSNREFAVSFGTEAGVFNNGGVPAIVCGPGNIEQAHKPNEWIEISQIQACVEFMLRLCEDPVLKI